MTEPPQPAEPKSFNVTHNYGGPIAVVLAVFTFVAGVGVTGWMNRSAPVTPAPIVTPKIDVIPPPDRTEDDKRFFEAVAHVRLLTHYFADTNNAGGVAKANELGQYLFVGPGPVPVPPIPIPPVPPPIPPPTPPVPEVGERTILIFRETAEETPEFARVITALRNGESAAYLKSKGHKLYVLDDDAVDETGKPAPIVEAWRQHFAGMKVPVLLITDGKSVIAKQEIKPGMTAMQIVEAVRAAGG